MKRSKETPQEDVDYWRSMVDVVLGILLVVLLALSLLILGLMDEPVLEYSELVQVEASPSPTITITPTPTMTPTPTPTPTPYTQSGGGGGGGNVGGGWADHSGENDTPTPSPTIFEDNLCAVRVAVRDADTNQLLLKSGISFELYNGGGQVETLGVYYPERVLYDTFETSRGGSFYLPEKLSFDEYRLKNLAITQEYDLADDVRFTVDTVHHWNDPLVVDVLVSPCKNRVLLHMVNAATNEAIPNGVYEIVAAENIITADGTRRYSLGEVVDTLSCDMNGQAVSKELYVGNFVVRQTEAAFSYARLLTDTPVQLARRSKKADETDGTPVELANVMTSMTLVLRDELHQNRLAGVTYRLTSQRGGNTTVVTDDNGEVRMIGLDKDAEYHLIQTKKFGNYRLDTNDYTFTVDADGYIDGQAEQTLTLNARMLRCDFTVKSALMGTTLVGQDMGLFGTDGTMIHQWQSGSDSFTVEGLDPGDYVLSLGDKRMTVTVADKAELQTFVYRVWGTTDMVLLAGGGLGVVLVAALIVVLILRGRKRAAAGTAEKSKTSDKRSGRKA